MKNLIKISFLMLAVSMFVACKNTKGKDAEVSDKVEKASKAEGKNYTVDTGVSKVMWEGTKPTSGHNGTVDVSEGTVIVSGDAVVGGSFTLDMNTIKNLDIADEGKRGYLESHLKGLGDDNADDFNKKNKRAYTELVQVLNEKSLQFVVRDAKDDGRKAFKILKEHYASIQNSRVLSLYEQLTTVKMNDTEDITDYLIRAKNY